MAHEAGTGVPYVVTTFRTSAAIRVLAVLASVAALYLAREFFIPIALALCLHALLRPFVRFLEKIHVPTALAAGLVVILAVGVGVGAGWGISLPVQDWATKAPTALTAARRKLANIRRPFQRISDAAEGTHDSDRPSSTQAPPPPAPSAGPSLLTRFLGATTSIIGTLAEVIILAFLMLASGEVFLTKLMRLFPNVGGDVVHATEDIVARWLFLAAAINAGQGIAVGFTLKLLGMPDPLIWGLMTFALEFIPYLGAATMIVLLGIMAFTVFPTIEHALLIPAAYLVIATLQNSLVSPILFGGRLKLNPVAVLVSVLFWWFLWGVPGAFLAIPITATLKVVSDQVPRLAPLGEFLGSQA